MTKWEDRFREYLRKYCEQRDILPEVAIKHKIVQEVKKQYEKAGDIDAFTTPKSGWTESGCCK